VSEVVTKYALSGGASIAYHSVGSGPTELFYVPGPASNVELMWEEPVTARYLRRIASFARLVLFDRRGLRFRDRGTHELKGIPDTWQRYAVEPGAELDG
jgi:hypothetical protein